MKKSSILHKNIKYMIMVQKKLKEKNIQRYIAYYITNKYNKSFLLEIKVNNNKLLPHQKKALLDVSSGRFFFKIPDTSFGRLPADYFGLINSDALLARCKNDKCIVYKYPDYVTVMEFSLKEAKDFYLKNKKPSFKMA